MSSFSKYQGSQPVFKRLALLLAFSLAALLSSTIQVQAQNVTYTWQNANGSWTNTTGAWSPTTGPQLSSTTNNTDTALFSNVGANFNAVSLTSNRTVYGLLFSSTANAYTFTSIGRDLSVMSNLGLTNNSSQVQTFNTAVANSGATGLWTSVAGGSLVFNSGVNLTTSSSSASRTLILAGAGTITVNSTIANGGTATAGIITVTSTGSTNFLGNNTYDGLTTMNAIGGILTLGGDNSGAAGGVTLTAGTLNINHAKALGSGALTISANTTINNTSGAAITNLGNQSWTLENGLTFGNANSTSANNLNLGSGSVTVSSSRIITVAGTNTTLAMGSANITSTSSARTLTANGIGNTLELGGLSLSQNTTADVAARLEGTANITINGPILSGARVGHGVTISNTGTTSFNGANTYGGLTTLNAASAILNLNGDNSGAAGGVTLTLGTLNINHANALGSGTLSIAGGTIDNTTGAPITLATNNAQNWNGSFAFTGTNDLNLGTGAVTMGASRTLTVNAGNLGVGGDISGAGGLTKAGNGTLTLGGTNTYTGATTLSAGTIQALSTAALASTSTLVTGGSSSGGFGLKLASAGSYTMDSLDLKGILIVNGPDSGNATLTFTNGGVTTSTSSSRKIQAASGVTIVLDGASFDIATYSATPTRNLLLEGDGNIVFNAVLSNGVNATNTGGIEKNSNGAARFNAANTYTGETTLNAGTLFVDGSTSAESMITVNGGVLAGVGTIGGNVTVGSTGTISGGENSVGTLSLSSSLILNGGSTFSAGIGGGLPGTEYNQIAIAGILDLNGANNLALSLAYTPTPQQLFFLTVGASDITGTFNSLNGVDTTLDQGSAFTLGDQQFIIGYSA
jgi:autotransporter-associated beta strand protein